MWISYNKRREDCIIHNIPIISIHTENFIKDYLQKHKPKSIIEIGSAVWYSTSILWQTLESYDRQGEIKSREISYPHYRQALQSTSPYKSITIFMGNFCHYNCDMFLKKSYYDMVFIDGRKSETLQYLLILSRYIHPDTHIIIDDVIKFKSKMQDFYDFLDKHHIPYSIEQLDSDDGILIIPQSQQFLQALSSL